MSLAQYGLFGWALLSVLVWALTSIVFVIRAHQIRHLSSVDYRPPKNWPSISVIIPACNEAAKIEQALQSLLAADYPDLEFVVINDRSTDGTGEIIDRLAEQDERIRPIHIDELPQGWLGKVHALQKGYEAATGEWLLLTDADIEYTEDALRRCTAHVLDERADHLACIPQFRTTGFSHELILLSYIMGIAAGLDTPAIEDPETDDYIGVGAFNLLHRSMLEPTEGFAPLRMELADDVGVGLLVEEHGGRTLLVYADDALAFDWYESTSAVIRGVEKNAFPVLGRFSFTVGLLRGAAPLLALGGLTAGLLLPVGWLNWLAIATLVLGIVSNLVVAPILDRPLLPALFGPVGHLLMTYAFFRSAWLCWRQGGVQWRGTVYPLDELRDGQIVEL